MSFHSSFHSYIITNPLSSTFNTISTNPHEPQGYSVYLIDRKFDIARVPIRFLRYVEAKDRKATAGLKFGTFHSNTLLDGEMVVDDDVVNGASRIRRRQDVDFFLVQHDFCSGYAVFMIVHDK